MDIYTHSHSAQRLDIVDSGRRRRFSNEAKRRIVAESLQEPGLCSVTARRHGISRSQLYEWRRLARAGKFGDVDRSDTVEGFIPAVIMTGPVVGKAIASSDACRIEIVAANGRRLIVDGSVDVEALLRIIRGLETLR